jgi:hypothetical protein
VALLLTADLTKAGEGKPVGLVVEAWVSTAGPYGQSWNLKIVPSGEAALQVFYMSAPSGTLMARFSLSAQQLAGIRSVVETERFFELPAKISPTATPMHRPAFRLDVWLEGRHHTVALYDPGQLEADAKASRFFAVWKQLYQDLPIKPSW